MQRVALWLAVAALVLDVTVIQVESIEEKDYDNENEYQEADEEHVEDEVEHEGVEDHRDEGAAEGGEGTAEGAPR